MTTFEWIQTATSIGATVDVGIAAWQLRLAKQHEQSQFEDSFVEQYRGILARLPLEALLNQKLTDQALKAHLRAFYEYFDLCNQQAFLARQGSHLGELEGWHPAAYGTTGSRTGLVGACTTPGRKLRRAQAASPI